MKTRAQKLEIIKAMMACGATMDQVCHQLQTTEAGVFQLCKDAKIKAPTRSAGGTFIPKRGVFDFDIVGEVGSFYPPHQLTGEQP